MLMWACVAHDADGYQSLSVTLVLPVLKPFYPCINFVLSHVVFTSVLIQHPTVNFSRLHSFWPKRSHYSTLFNSAISQQDCPCSCDLGFSQTKGVHVWTTHQPFHPCFTVSASVHYGYWEIFKLPLLSDFLSYIKLGTTRYNFSTVNSSLTFFLHAIWLDGSDIFLSPSLILLFLVTSRMFNLYFGLT